VAAAITVERLAPAGERVARAIGAVVVGAGLFLIARAAGLGWRITIYIARFGGLSVESEGRREAPLSADLRLQIGDLLLREGNGIRTGDKALE